MSDPVTLRVVRPYRTEEELIAAEAWTVGAKSMVLLDQPELPKGTTVRFDLTLEDGTKLMRAEARVVGVADAEDDRPAGLRVKFRRFGKTTKAFIERVHAALDSPPKKERGRVSIVDEEQLASDPVASDGPLSEESAEHEDSGEAAGPSRPRHPVEAVAPPANRDELLERLRQRALRMASAEVVDEDSR